MPRIMCPVHRTPNEHTFVLVHPVILQMIQSCTSLSAKCQQIVHILFTHTERVRSNLTQFYYRFSDPVWKQVPMMAINDGSENRKLFSASNLLLVESI